MVWMALLIPTALAVVPSSSRPALRDPNSGQVITITDARRCASDATGLTVSARGVFARRPDGAAPAPLGVRNGRVVCGAGQASLLLATGLEIFPARSNVALRVRGGTIEGLDADGKRRFLVDAVARCPVAVGEPVVRAIEFGPTGPVQVILGKHTFALLHPETGTLQCKGAD